MEESVANKPKKVLLVITKSNWGGAQRYVYDLATHLGKQYEVAVVAGGTGAPGSSNGVLFQKLTQVQVRTLFVASLTRNIRLLGDVYAFYELWQLFRKEKPDVVHLNSSKAGGVGALAARCAQVPRIIFTAHGWPFWEKRVFPLPFVIRLLSWITVVLSHKTICISQKDKDALSHFPLVRKKVEVIYNGIESIPFIERMDARKTLFDNAHLVAHEKDAWVVTIAEMTRNKNLFQAIDTVTTYNTTHPRRIFYTIIGTGELEASIVQYIKKKKMENHIHAYGFLDDARSYLKAFDVFYLPSLKEGVPYVLLEAMQAKLPIVASNVGGIPEVIGTKSGVLVDSSNIQKNVLGLEKGVCFGNVEENKQYDLEEMARKTLEMY